MLIDVYFNMEQVKNTENMSDSERQIASQTSAGCASQYLYFSDSSNDSDSGSPVSSPRRHETLESGSCSPLSRNRSIRSRNRSIESGSGSLSNNPRNGTPRSRSSSPRSRSSSSRGMNDSCFNSLQSVSSSPNRRSISGSQEESDHCTSATSLNALVDEGQHLTRYMLSQQGPRRKRHYSDGDSHSEHGSDLVADIFGSSDEEEEFEGFCAADIESHDGKSKEIDNVVKNSENSSEARELIANIFGSSDEEEFEGSGVNKVESKEENEANTAAASEQNHCSDEDNEDFVSDFDLMIAAKKAEKRRQKQKRIDPFTFWINDPDIMIADLLEKMKVAAQEDRELNKQKKPAIKKLKLLPYFIQQMSKVDFQTAFIEIGALYVMKEWLEPLPDKSLPNIQIRTELLRLLTLIPRYQFHIDLLKHSGIGKALMLLYKHPLEVKTNKEMAGALINTWARPVFCVSDSYMHFSREERQERDKKGLPPCKKSKLNVDGGQTSAQGIEKALAGKGKTVCPGDQGWINRARVPMPSLTGYVVRPDWKVKEWPDFAFEKKQKKKLNRYDRIMSRIAERSQQKRRYRSHSVSIEGRHMTL